jgi:hypothetical protein
VVLVVILIFFVDECSFKLFQAVAVFFISGNDEATHETLKICVFQNDSDCNVFFITFQINARKWIKLHGQFKKSDPNSVKKDKDIGKKRKIGESFGGGDIHSSPSGYQGSCFVLSFPVFLSLCLIDVCESLSVLFNGVVSC